jgi:3-methyl-2-oxobutanoate hydroxymethyltransferase
MTDSTPTSPATPAPEGTAPYGTGAQAAPQRRVRIPHLLQKKERGERWAMLTAYDMYTAEIFDEAGIPVLLVGDSAGNNVYGFETTVPVTVDHLLPLCRAVTSAAKHAMVVADLPFGSYQASPQQALATATRFMKEGLAHAVKLEGGKPMVPEVELLVRAGIPVMGHIGFTPQSEHVLGGYKVQGRGSGADKLMDDALALEAAGCFAIVMEMVPAPVAAKVTEALSIPTIGIGAGGGTSGQVLVLSDVLGLYDRPAPKFAKRYVDLATPLRAAAETYRTEVEAGVFPAKEHGYAMPEEEWSAFLDLCGPAKRGVFAAAGKK